MATLLTSNLESWITWKIRRQGDPALKVLDIMVNPLGSRKVFNASNVELPDECLAYLREHGIEKFQLRRLDPSSYALLSEWLKDNFEKCVDFYLGLMSLGEKDPALLSKHSSFFEDMAILRHRMGR